jgi:hypothetical protein
MTYNKKTTMLTIVVIAALMVGASVAVALTMISQGAGIQQANAAKGVKRAHICHDGTPTPCKPERARL